MREIRYRTIAAELRSQITAGELVAGAVLPSEADLAGSYGVSRVTVRKALEVLRDEGVVGSRQGFGWFVAVPLVRRSLGTLSTIEADLAAQGREPVRRILSFRFRDADRDGDDDLEVVRVNLADGQPFALVTVWCPAELGRSLSRDDVETSTFYDLLPVQLASIDQTIRAALADDRDAEVLGVPTGSPLLVALRISRDPGGDAFLRAEHRFPAHLTEFVLEGPGRPAPQP